MPASPLPITALRGANIRHGLWGQVPGATRAPLRAAAAPMTALLLLGSATAGLAQDVSPAATSAASTAPAITAPATAPTLAARVESLPTLAPGDIIQFAADAVRYDNVADVLSANGHVELNRDGWILRADAVEWNRKTGQVSANGNVAMTGPQGDTVFGDAIELSDSLRDGMIDNLLVVFDGGARMAAQRGTRLDNGDLTLDYAAYTPCAVENAQGCPISPSWQVRAVRVRYDRAHDRIRYDGARIELFGLPLVPLPGLSHPASGRAGSGFLVPDFRLDRVNGAEFALPYYLSMGPSRDLTLTPHIYTSAAPMAEATMRGLTANGAWAVQGFATYSQRVSVATSTSTGQDAFRGYLDGKLGMQFDPRWALTASGRYASDRT
ncbi:MAG: LPS-assembly protein LptD, partial [Sphingopyxis sp.]